MRELPRVSIGGPNRVLHFLLCRDRFLAAIFFYLSFVLSNSLSHFRCTLPFFLFGSSLFFFGCYATVFLGSALFFGLLDPFIFLSSLIGHRPRLCCTREFSSQVVVRDPMLLGFIEHFIVRFIGANGIRLLELVRFPQQRQYASCIMQFPRVTASNEPDEDADCE